MNVNCAEKILEEIIEDTLRDQGHVVRKVDNTIHRITIQRIAWFGLLPLWWIALSSLQTTGARAVMVFSSSLESFRLAKRQKLQTAYKCRLARQTEKTYASFRIS